MAKSLSSHVSMIDVEREKDWSIFLYYRKNRKQSTSYDDDDDDEEVRLLSVSFL